MYLEEFEKLHNDFISNQMINWKNCSIAKALLSLNHLDYVRKAKDVVIERLKNEASLEWFLDSIYSPD